MKILETLLHGAKSLSEAARTMSLFPELKPDETTPWEEAGKIIEKTWKEVGEAMYGAMGIVEREEKHESGIRKDR